MVLSNVEILDGKLENKDHSVAIITKGNMSVYIILKDKECIIYHKNETIQNYKELNSNKEAYKKWLSWTGKMCKKQIDSEYFQGSHSVGEKISFNSSVTLYGIFKKYLKNRESKINNSNLPVTDYQYHFGEDYVDDLGPKYLKAAKKTFYKKKRELIFRLHRLTHANKYNLDNQTLLRKDYIQTMGYDYIFRSSHSSENFDTEYILASIDTKYCNTQIHQIEVELAYINSNLKVINRCIKNRKDS